MKNRYVLLFTGFLLIIFVLIIKYVNNDITEELLVTRIDNTVLSFDKRKTTAATVVKVYYEVLCPDSKYFINRQLAPAWEKIVKNNASHLVDFQLIPYGKAVTTAHGNKYTFQCQHGVPECLLNKIHGCTLTQDLSFAKKLEMIKCSISTPKDSTEKCGMRECPAGDDLLRQYGVMTNELNPKIQFVPTITINDSQDHQSELLKNFYNVLIEHLNGT